MNPASDGDAREPPPAALCRATDLRTNADGERALPTPAAAPTPRFDSGVRDTAHQRESRPAKRTKETLTCACRQNCTPFPLLQNQCSPACASLLIPPSSFLLLPAPSSCSRTRPPLTPPSLPLLFSPLPRRPPQAGRGIHSKPAGTRRPRLGTRCFSLPPPHPAPRISNGPRRIASRIAAPALEIRASSFSLPSFPLHARASAVPRLPARAGCV
ncbi:hypothetical protein DFH09DRAFT_1404529, partial [Mycena vulgaris]